MIRETRTDLVWIPYWLFQYFFQAQKWKDSMV